MTKEIAKMWAEILNGKVIEASFYESNTFSVEVERWNEGEQLQSLVLTDARECFALALGTVKPVIG